MRNLLLLISLIILSTINFPAQTETASAPVAWERYKTSDHNLSVLLPKLPNRERNVVWCEQREVDSYFAYAEGAVYEVTIVKKIEGNHWRKICNETPLAFGDATLLKRIASLEGSETGAAKQSDTRGDFAEHQITLSGSTRRILSHATRKDLWIEIAVHHYPGDKPDHERFFNSLEPSDAGGKEIGHGAEATIGDPKTAPPTPMPAPATQKSAAGSGSGVGSGSGSGQGSGKAQGDGTGDRTNPLAPPDPNTSPYRTISQPRARYTDKARDSDVQGAVRVKITLLANGGVGSVVPVTGLPDGLTEQAIAAAKRIVFLPKRVHGSPVSLVVTREYTFTIY